MSDYFWAQSDRQIDPRWYDNGASVSSGWGLGASLSQAWHTSPGPAAARFARQTDANSAALFNEQDADQRNERGMQGVRESLRDLGEEGVPAEPSTRMLSAEEANRLYGIPNHLRFTRPVSEAAAVDQRDVRRAWMVRQDAIARAEGGAIGWTARMGASFIGAALDPVNIASAFIPIIGPEVWAARVAEQSTRLGRAAVAARMGAVEGMVGQALIEPANQFFAAREQRDDDFGMAAALQNVAFGAVLGSVLHGGGRLVVDGWRGLPRMDPGAERVIHETALRGAIAQLETGRAVDVEPVFQMARSLSRNELMSSAAPMALRAFEAPEVRARVDGMPARAGNEQVLGFQTARGSTYEMHPDGTTTRNKAARPEHPGDSGPKERSEATWFLTRENADRMAPPSSTSWRVIDNGDGTISLAARNQDGRWGISPSQRNVPVEAAPRDGMVPFEVWGREELNGRTAYTTLHPGNPIVAMRSADLSPPTPQATRQMIERASSEAVRSANPEAWAAAQAARSADIGGSRPRTETPVTRVQAEIAALDARIAEADAVLKTDAAAGRLTPDELRSLDMADAEARVQERSRGLEAGAACLILNGARP